MSKFNALIKNQNDVRDIVIKIDIVMSKISNEKHLLKTENA